MIASRKERQGRKEGAEFRDDSMIGIFGQFVDDPFDAIFEMNLPEVDQQTELAATQTQLGQDLFAVRARERFDRLEFNDDLVFRPTFASFVAFAPFA